jgi:hypothetical protein
MMIIERVGRECPIYKEGSKASTAHTDHRVACLRIQIGWSSCPDGAIAEPQMRARSSNLLRSLGSQLLKQVCQQTWGPRI